MKRLEEIDGLRFAAMMITMAIVVLIAALTIVRVRELDLQQECMYMGGYWYTEGEGQDVCILDRR